MNTSSTQIIVIDGKTYTLISRTTVEQHRAEGRENVAAMMEQAGIVATIGAERPKARKAYLFNERLDSRGQTYYQFVIRF
jgi:hypothetical protein